MSSIYIIDNKKINLTTDEWRLYEEICKGYDNPPATRGKDLFSELFETDEKGIIIFLRPPRRATTMEVCLFLVNVMVQQQMRINKEAVSNAVKRVDEAVKKVEEALGKIKKQEEALTEEK
jgi:hypothetical protein